MEAENKVRKAGRGATPYSARRAVLRPLAHRVVFPLVENLNASIFRLVGLLLRPRATLLMPTGVDRVLVIAPHPDDETLGCGGTLARHADAGDRVCVVIVTDGGLSRAMGLDHTQMVASRREEAKRAISRLTVDERHTNPIELRQLGLPEGSWQDEELGESLDALLNELQPTLIYTPSRVDFHPEHLRVARVVGKSLGRCNSRARVRAYELQVPLTPVLANVASPVLYVEMRKRAALACYETQAGSFLWVARHRRYLMALYYMGPAEVFWETSPDRFATLHRGGRHFAFRSIRLRPFTDLAAWTIGWRERAAIRSLTLRGAGSVVAVDSNPGHNVEV